MISYFPSFFFSFKFKYPTTLSFFFLTLQNKHLSSIIDNDVLMQIHLRLVSEFAKMVLIGQYLRIPFTIV